MNAMKYIALSASIACIVSLTGCVTYDSLSGTSYPEYNFWWR